MRTYEEPAYAATRLKECIVRLKDGTPVFVNGIARKDVVGYALATPDVPLKNKLEDLDINPVPLGYTNTAFGAVYVTRIPMREDWRQGLRRINIRTIPVMDIDYECLDATIRGVYPTFKEAIKLADKRGVAAFSRSFAVDKDKTIWYKGRWKVGKVDMFGHALDEKFTWLRESLDEELVAA
jgi:hypothetical protein